MGTGYILIYLVVIGVIAAFVGALILGGITFILTRGVKKDRKKAILAAALFPVVCLAWAGIIFLFQAVINEELLQRDCGLGDGFYCPVPNGYMLSMTDGTDYGILYNPKTQPGHGVILGNRSDVINGVLKMQISGRFIIAGSDSKAEQNMGEHIDKYVVLDTESGKQTTFASYEAFLPAWKQGMPVNLQPIARVYFKYRYTWFDTLATLLMLVPLLLTFGLLVRWIIRIGSTS